MTDKSYSIRLVWPELGLTVRACLLAQQSAPLKDVLWDSLPIVSIQSHAVVAGRQMYFPVRLLLPAQLEHGCYWEPMDRQPAGRLNLDPAFQYLAINYERPTEPVPALPLAQVIDEDMDTLVSVGEKVWYNLLFERGRFLTVRVERGDVDHAVGVK